MTRPYILKSRKPKALAKNVAAVRAFILKNEGATMDKVSESIDRSEAVAHGAIAELRKEKWVFTQMNSRVARYYSMEYAIKNRIPHKIAQPYTRSKRSIPAVNESSHLSDMLMLNKRWPAPNS